MKIIGIDLGTSLGISILDTDNPHQILVTGRHVEAKTYGAQFVHFDSVITMAIAQARTGYEGEVVVFFEDIKRHSSTAAAHMYGYYRGALQRMCYGANIECVGIAVGTIKKNIAGMGNADKAAVAEGCVARMAADGKKLYTSELEITPKKPRLSKFSHLNNDQTDSMAIAFTGIDMIRFGGKIIDSSDPKRRVVIETKLTP